MTGEDAKQRTLEGLVLTTPEELETIVERVLAKHGLIQAAKSSKWDRSYKGDAWWLEFRAHVIRLLQANLAVAYRDLDRDPFFVKSANLTTDRQWTRAVNQHLVPGKPPGEDGLDLATFSLGPRSGRYLTARSWMHCAIAKVAQRHDREDPVLIRKIRTEYRAEGPCERCRPGPASPVSHSVSPEGTRVTNLVRVTSQNGESALDPEERALLQALNEGRAEGSGED